MCEFCSFPNKRIDPDSMDFHLAGFFSPHAIEQAILLAANRSQGEGDDDDDDDGDSSSDDDGT